MALGMVVLNYNDYKTTIKFLEMIKKYKGISKVIVVDNNSTDESVERLKRYIDNRVVLLEAKENKGYGAGNNIGIKYLREVEKIKYICISNPDIEFENNDLIKLVEFLEKNNSISMVSGRIIENGKKAKDGAWKIPGYTKCLLQTIPLLDKKIDKSLSYPETYYTGEYSLVEAVKGCFFVVDSDDMKSVNDFDENTFLYYEENILGYKMKNNNLNIAVLNDVNIIHAHGATINKALNKIEKFKILNKSRCIYLNEYIRIGKVKIVFYKFIQAIGINLRKVLYYIQDLIRK